jgi:hypothetical protein
MTMGDGREREVRVLGARIGRLCLDILVDRSFNDWRCDLGGMPVSSDAPGRWYGEQETDGEVAAALASAGR